MATATRRSRSFWEQLSAEADRVGSVAAVTTYWVLPDQFPSAVRVD